MNKSEPPVHIAIDPSEMSKVDEESGQNPFLGNVEDEGLLRTPQHHGQPYENELHSISMTLSEEGNDHQHQEEEIVHEEAVILPQEEEEPVEPINTFSAAVFHDHLMMAKAPTSEQRQRRRTSSKNNSQSEEVSKSVPNYLLSIDGKLYQLSGNQLIQVEDSRQIQQGSFVQGINEDEQQQQQIIESISDQNNQSNSTAAMISQIPMQFTDQTEQQMETFSYTISTDVEQQSANATASNNQPLSSYSLKLPKYIFPTPLCRVCLLPKSNTSPIFENVSITANGVVANSRGPNSKNPFRIVSALKELLNLKLEYGDGLGDQICNECLDEVMGFSLFRKRIAIGQGKLEDIVKTVEGTNNPTIMPAMGETDILKTEIYKNAEAVVNAQSLLKSSNYSHLVSRNLSDRIWDLIFTSIPITVSPNSPKLKSLEKYIIDFPYVSGFFCIDCKIMIHGTRQTYFEHCMVCHEVKSEEEMLYSCDICSVSLPLNDATGLSKGYCEHWLQHFYFFECDVCKKRMISLKGLEAHKRNTHVRTNDKKFVCEICSKRFGKKSHWEAHKKTHMEPEERKKYLVDCKICDKSMTSSSLIIHMNSVHNTARKYSCDMCSKNFKRKELLILHRDVSHFNIKRYECSFCGEFFKSHSTRKQHEKRHGEKDFKCDECEKRFYTSHALKNHQLKHQVLGENVSCDICKKTFKRKSYLAEHKKMHNGDSHECHLCGKVIKMKSNFYKHLKIHKRRNELAASAATTSPTPLLQNGTSISVDGQTLEVIFDNSIQEMD